MTGGKTATYAEVHFLTGEDGWIADFWSALRNLRAFPLGVELVPLPQQIPTSF